MDISLYQRAAKGKIITEEKYKGGKPGSLDLRVNYDAGCLYVGLGQASLYGKPSQVIFYLSPFKLELFSTLATYGMPIKLFFLCSGIINPPLLE